RPVAEAPGGDAFPPAGPPVVPAGLFDARTLNDREEVEDPEARTVRFNPRPLRVREELPDPVVAEIEETGRNLEPELHHVPVDALNLGDLLLDRDVGELLRLWDRPVHGDRVFLGERDLRLPPRGFRDLDRVVHDCAHAVFRQRVRRGESERAVHQDADADALVVAHVQRVQHAVLEDEILRILLLVSRLRIGRSLRSRLVNGKIHEVHFGVHVSAPPDGLGQSGYGSEGIVSRDSDQTLMASARFGPRPCRRETDPSSSIPPTSTSVDPGTRNPDALRVLIAGAEGRPQADHASESAAKKRHVGQGRSVVCPHMQPDAPELARWCPAQWAWSMGAFDVNARWSRTSLRARDFRS